jgi:hypothetical protein
MKRQVLWLILFYAVFCYSSKGHGEWYWAKTYGGSNTEIAYSIIQTFDGGFIVAGDTDSFGASGDCLIIKLDASGNFSWQKTYGGSGLEVAWSIQQTFDGGSVVAGRTYSFGQGMADILVMKLDEDGNIIWQKAYGGSNDDIAYSIQQTSDNGYIVAGITKSYGSGNWDGLMLKLDLNGNVVWQKTYGGSNGDLALSVNQTSDSGYIVAGYTRSFGAGSYDFWVLKLDSAGNTIWQKTYGGNGSDQAVDIQQTIEGGYIVAGVINYAEAVSGDFWLLKLDNNGNTTWQKSYGGNREDSPCSIQQTSDNGYIVAGYTKSFGAVSYNYWLLKLDNTGNISWEKIYGTSNDGGALSVKQTYNGGYIVAGKMFSSETAGTDFGVLKLDENGDIPLCDIIATSAATVSDTNVSGINTEITGLMSYVNINNTAITPRDSSAEINTTCENLTLIELSSFDLYPSNKKVLIRWSTESEVDNAGFNLYRSNSENGEYIKINDRLILATGSPVEGALYEFVDENVKNNKTYCYKLEDININGASTIHGPETTPRFVHGLDY